MENKKFQICEKLYTLKGDIYRISPDEYDGAIIFLDEGLTSIKGMYGILKDRLAKSPISFLVFGDESGIPFNHKRNKFQSSFDVEEYVKSLTYNSLSLMKSLGLKKLAFHGIRISVHNDREMEAIVIRTCKTWIKDNYESIESLTLIDLRDSYYKHFFQKSKVL